MQSVDVSHLNLVPLIIFSPKLDPMSIVLFYPIWLMSSCKTLTTMRIAFLRYNQLFPLPLHKVSCNIPIISIHVCCSSSKIFIPVMIVSVVSPGRPLVFPLISNSGLHFVHCPFLQVWFLYGILTNYYDHRVDPHHRPKSLEAASRVYFSFRKVFYTFSIYR